MIKTIGEMNNIMKNVQSDNWIKQNENLQNNLQVKKPEHSYSSASTQGSFGEMMIEALNKVNNLQLQANSAIDNLVSGKTKNIHETMIAVEKADVAFRTMNQVRNKVIEAYREIMKMQV